MKTKKLLAMLLAIAMITAIVPGLAITAGAADIVTAEVISGNKPVLPDAVAWENADYTNDTAEPIIVPVTGTAAGGEEVKAQVTVYPMTFTMPNQESTNGQPGNVVYMPTNLTSEFSMEFDLTVNAIRDSSVQIGKDGRIFGGGQIGLGTTNGNFTPTSGNGTGGGNTGNAITTVEAGKTYRIFLTVNAAANSYTSALTKEDGSKFEAGTRYFRTNADYINTITMLTNGGGANGDLKISNVKFYAPGADITPYTVHFEGVDRADETVYPNKDSIDKLPVNAYIPSYNIPYIEGYVFSDYSLSGTTYTLKYEESTDSLGTWYTRNNLSDPGVSLNLMHFLGAHDAFTAKISTSSIGDAAGAKTNDAGSKAAVMTGATSTVVNTSKTQEYGTYGMLNAGVRYFDIRLSVSDESEPNTPMTFFSKTQQGTNGEYYTTHGLLAQPFKTVLYTIRDFCKENPGEVIVLDFQTLYNALDAYGEGASTNANWDDVYNLLVETGVSEFMVSGTTSPSGHTWSSMTNNGQRAAVVCFGQAGSQNTQSAHFISASSRRAGGGGDGYLYSYFDGSAPSSYSNLITDIQNNQVANIGTNVWPFRIMQAIFGSAPVTNARTTTESLINEDGFEAWIQALPVVMIDNAAKDTSNYLELFASFNRDGSDKTYTATVEGVKIEGPTASVPFSTKLTGAKSGNDYTFTLTRYSGSDIDLAGEVTLTFPDATGGKVGHKTVVYCDGEKLAEKDAGSSVSITADKIKGKTFSVVDEFPVEISPALGWDGENFTVDFLLGDAVGTYTVEVFNGENSIGSKTVEISETNKGLAVGPAHTNAIYSAKVKNAYGSVLGTGAPASVYSLVAEALADFWYVVKDEQKKAALDVLENGGFYLVRDGADWKLNDEAAMIMEIKGDTITLNENVINAGLTFGGKMAIEASDGTSLSVEVDGVSAKIAGLNNISLAAAVIYLEDVEFVFEDIAENAADEAVSGELDFVEEV